MPYRNFVSFTVLLAIIIVGLSKNQEIINDQQNLHQSSNEVRQFQNFEIGRSADQRLLKMLASTGPDFAPLVVEDTTLEPQGAPRPPINVQDANYMSAVASLPQRGGLLGVSGPLAADNTRQFSNVESPATQTFDENPVSRSINSGQRSLHVEGMQKEAMIKEMMLRAMQQNQGRFVSPRYPQGQNLPQQGPMITNFHRYMMQNAGGVPPHAGQIPPIFNNPRQYQLADQVDSGDSLNPFFLNVNPKRSQQILGAPTPIQIGEILGYPSGASFSPMPFSNNNAWEAERSLLQWKNGQNYANQAAWGKGANAAVAFSAPNTGDADAKKEEQFEEEETSTPNPQQPVNVSIVAFTRSSCGQICAELEKIFKNYHNLSADIFEVEKMPVDGQEALLSLYQKSGIKVMPQVYVCNKFVGGIDKIRHLQKTKKLDDIVKRCS